MPKKSKLKPSSLHPQGFVAGSGFTPWSDRPLLLFALAAVAYSLLFLASTLPGLSEATGQPWPRWRFLLLLLAPEGLISGWFGTPPSPAFADRLPLLAALATIVVVAWCAGSLIMRVPARARLLTRLERALFSIAIGLNVVSLYTLLAGLAGLVRYRLVFLVPGLAVLIAAAAMRRFGRRPPRWQDFVDREPYLRSPWLWLSIPFALLILLGAMLPPIEFDVREYHLQAPKEFFQLGRISFLPHNVYANMSLGSEMHGLLGMTLLGDWWHGALVGKTMQAVYTLLTALALLAAGRRWFSTSAGALAALVYLSTPWIAVVSTTGLVEGALAFYALLTLYALLLISERQVRRISTSLIGLIGFLAGSAVAVKYPAMLFVLLPAAATVVWFTRPHAIRALAVFCVAAAVACGPWFAKNWVLTGNPTYPLLYEVFGGETRTEDKDERWSEAHRPAGFSVEQLVRSISDFTLRSQSLGLLIWPLAIVGYYAARSRTTRSAMAYVLFYFAAWWLCTHRIDRFWVPALAPLALVSGAAWLWTTTTPRKAAMSVFISFGSIYGLAVLATPLLVDHSYFVSLDYLRVDPVRVSAWHRWLNENTPSGKSVLSVGDAQVFDIEVPVLYNTAFDDSILELRVADPDGRLRPTEEIATALDDVAYVYVNWGEIARYRSPGNYGYSPFVQPQIFYELVERGILQPPVKTYAGGAVQIYPVTPKP